MNNRNEKKELLLKDLCARLPYDMIINVNDGKYRKDVKLHPHYIFDWDAERWDAKPYLRPMSSMTEEERKMVCTINALSEAELDDRIKYLKMYVNSYTIETFDLFNSNHIDYRDLISMGLAIKVTEENNPYKE